MLPDEQLSIYELRAPSKKALELFDKTDLKALLGEGLLGYHLEEDFVFFFCSRKTDLRPVFRLLPGLELKEEHRLRYDEWQDGAGASPIFLGPLSILPFDHEKSYPPWLFSEGFLEHPGELDEYLPQSRLKMSFQGLSGYPGLLPPVVIDPGLAFGYGGHPTTKACLSFLLRIMNPLNPCIPESFLDLGTGTGVLALAAMRLGGKKAFGVDYSHLAAQCAINNAKLNKLEGKVRFVHGLAGDFAKVEAQVLFANIPLAVHFELLEKGAYKDR
jgi:hypothetical protein